MLPYKNEIIAVGVIGLFGVSFVLLVFGYTNHVKTMKPQEALKEERVKETRRAIMSRYERTGDPSAIPPWWHWVDGKPVPPPTAEEVIRRSGI